MSRLAGFFIACAIALSCTSTADAANYCVNKSPCPGGGSTQTTIQNALDAAALTMAEDTVYIGANGGTPYVGNLNYMDTDVVHIVGDGMGQTIIQGTGADHALDLLNSDQSTVSDLTLRGSSTATARTLYWEGTASRIEATLFGQSNAGVLEADGPAVLEDSVIRGETFPIFTADSPNAPLTVRDSTITSTGNGSALSVSAGSDLTLDRSFLTGPNRVFTVSGSGSTADVTNVVMRRIGTGSSGVVFGNAGSATTLSHTTLIGPGDGYGLELDVAGSTASAEVRDSIIDNVGLSILCRGAGGGVFANLAVTYTSLSDPLNVSDAECNESLVNNDTTTVPAFVDAANRDYRLVGGSPLINAADPADPTTTDFDNAPRPIGGRTDMGAYEYRAQAPAVGITAPPTASAGETVTFTGTGTDEDGDPLTYAWEFGDGATATGADTTHVFAAAGTYEIKLTVTDSAGLSTQAAANLLVRDGELPPPPPPDPPKLTGFQASPNKVKARKAAPKLVAGGTKGLLFALNTAAKVTLTLERCKGKRGCSNTKAVKGSAEFDAPAGASAIVFKGSLDGKSKLRKGRYIATLTPAGGDPATAKLKIK